MNVSHINRTKAVALLKEHDFDLERTLRLEWDSLPKKHDVIILEGIFDRYKGKNDSKNHIDIDIDMVNI